MLKKLEDEKYLEEDFGYTIEGVVDKEVVIFERDLKRRIDVTDKRLPTTRIELPGLKANEEKGLRRNIILLTKQAFRVCGMNFVDTHQERSLQTFRKAPYRNREIDETTACSCQ